MSEMSETLLTCEQILQATGAAFVSGGGELCITAVQTDSRQVEEGSLFVPLLGEKQDGHKFIPEALSKGATAVLLCMENFEQEGQLYSKLFAQHPAVHFFAVENTLKALQQLAACYVEKFPRLIKVGITGSSGKTTTKEILVSMLSQKYRVVSNEGNLNSETGLPLSVFKIRSDHECGVFELGMNRAGEIGETAGVLKPRFAILTNISSAHVGMMGSVENIAREKVKIFSHFGGFGTAVIPQECPFDEIIRNEIEGKVVTFGEGNPVKLIKDDGLKGQRVAIDGEECYLHLAGRHNLLNASAAACMAKVLGLKADQIARGIEAVRPLHGRCQVRDVGEFVLIDDCYNANPDSMQKALEFLSSIECNGAAKICVLADMLELGERSDAEHSKIGQLAAHCGASLLIFVGSLVKAAYDASQGSSAKRVFIEGSGDDAMEAVSREVTAFASAFASSFASSFASQNAQEGAKPVVLLKGSRGMHLERVASLLEGSGREAE